MYLLVVSLLIKIYIITKDKKTIIYCFCLKNLFNREYMDIQTMTNKLILCNYGTLMRNLNILLKDIICK